MASAKMLKPKELADNHTGATQALFSRRGRVTLRDEESKDIEKDPDAYTAR